MTTIESKSKYIHTYCRYINTIVCLHQGYFVHGYNTHMYTVSDVYMSVIVAGVVLM